MVTAHPDAVPSARPPLITWLFRRLLVVIPAGVAATLALGALSCTGFMPQARLKVPYVALAVLLGLFPWLANSLRLLVWTRFLGPRLALRDALAISVATDLGSALSPTAVGGGYVKLAMLVHRGVRPGAAAALMTLGSLEDGIFFAFSVPTALLVRSSIPLGGRLDLLTLVQRNAPRFLVALSLVAGAVAFAAALGRTHPLAARLRGLLGDCLSVYRLLIRRGKWRLGLSLVLTGTQWACRCSVATAVLASLGIRVDPIYSFAMQWIVFTLGVLVPTPGAVGGAEGAFLLVYRPLVPAPSIGSATVGWRFLTFYLQLVLGMVVFIACGGWRLATAAPRGARTVTKAARPSHGNVRYRESVRV